jgi:hypothetical protein
MLASAMDHLKTGEKSLPIRKKVASQEKERQSHCRGKGNRKT